MLNRAVLVGRLTKDVDLRYTQSGRAVANFTLAVNRPFRNQNGENEADFINMTAWNKTAENLANYMSKGSQIGVDGRIQSGSYENNEGQRIFTTEVVADQIAFLETKNSNGASGNQQSQNQNNNFSQYFEDKSGGNPYQGQGQPFDIDDDSLPF